MNGRSNTHSVGLYSYTRDQDSLSDILYSYSPHFKVCAVRNVPKHFSLHRFRFDMTVYVMYNAHRYDGAEPFTDFISKMSSRYAKNILTRRHKDGSRITKRQMRIRRLYFFDVPAWKNGTEKVDLSAYDLMGAMNLMDGFAMRELMARMLSNTTTDTSGIKTESGYSISEDVLVGMGVRVLDNLDKYIRTVRKKRGRKGKHVRYETARSIMSASGIRIRSLKQWADWIECHDIPQGIPRYPHLVYKEFTTMAEFTGCDR